MSKYKTIDVWNRVFGAKQEAYDYAGRLMKKSACGDPKTLITRRLTTSARFPPAAAMSSKTSSFAIVIPTRKKADHFPHWKANGTHYHARRVKGSRVEYEIIED